MRAVGETFTGEDGKEYVQLRPMHPEMKRIAMSHPAARLSYEDLCGEHGQERAGAGWAYIMGKGPRPASWAPDPHQDEDTKDLPLEDDLGPG